MIHSHISEKILIDDYGIANDKIFFCPHPNYIGAYGDEVPYKCENDELLKVLFIGAIKPYKNIEILIDVFKDFVSKPIELTIVGNVSDNSYKEFICNYSEGVPNIKLKLEFINDKDIPSILSMCDVVLLPYDIASSLNSGTALLAFSYRKTVICPRIGTILNLPFEDYIFTYDYVSSDDHKSRISESLHKILGLGKRTLREYGSEMYNLISKENSLSTISESLDNIYKSTLNISRLGIRNKM